MTALLESTELVVRGDVRARASLPDIERVAVRGERLECTVAGDRVRLELGAAVARQWAGEIAAPEPTLARKLGIDATTRIHVTGDADDDALLRALADARELAPSFDAADLAMVRTDDGDVLERWCADAGRATHLPPTWIVYVKGRAAPLGEAAVRDTLRRFGFVDTKVASVLERLTALRFVRRT